MIRVSFLAFLFLPAILWPYKPAFHPLDMRTMIQLSPCILVVQKETPFNTTNHTQFKCGLRRIPLEYTIDHFKVLEVLKKSQHIINPGQVLAVYPVDWDKHGDISVMYDCHKHSPHKANQYYDRRTDLSQLETLIIFIQYDKKVWSYTLINALEDPARKEDILKMINGDQAEDSISENSE